MRGTRYLSACFHTVSVWGSTPATPSNTATAPSRTRRPLDLDGEVDVAGRVEDVDLVVVPEARRGADVMVMLRSCSLTIQSMVAAPSWTSPIL